VNQLIGIYRRIDDAMWTSVANAGLLRRARKDLATLHPEIVDETDDALTVALDAVRVTLDAGGPATAVCDCPSTGVCRHIIAAGLWLAALEPDTPDSAGVATELAAFDREYLLRHAGRAGYRWARDHVVTLDADHVITLDDGSMQLTLPGVILRFPGGELTAMTAEPPVDDLPRWQVCAVLSYQRSVGVSVGDPGPLEPTPAECRRAAEHRQMYDRVRRLLCDIVSAGTAHMSAATVERCDAAAITAQTQDHFRLAASLRRLAAGGRAILDRTARAGDESLFAELAWCLTLVSALAAAPSPPERLLGSGRTGYREVGTLELIGLGAYPWRADSGYLGLTAVFWCVTRSAFLTYTDTRPATIDTFDPRAQYRRHDPVWTGLSSVSAATGARVLLSEAKINEQGRLSRSAESHAVVTTLDHRDIVASLPVIDEWTAVAGSGRGRALLDPPEPHGDWVVLSPSATGIGRFDPIGQVLTRPVFDTADRSLDLRLTYDEVTGHAVARLDTDTRLPAGGLIVGRRNAVGAGADSTSTVMPVSVIDADATRTNPVDALHFDPASTDPSGEALPAAPTTRPAPRTATTALLDTFAGRLIGTMERGTGGRGARELDDLDVWHQRLDRAGFGVFHVKQSDEVDGVGGEERLLRSYAVLLQVLRSRTT
jgi:hypothetical protein